MKAQNTPKLFSGIVLIVTVLLMGCEKSTNTSEQENTSTVNDVSKSEKRVFLKEPPQEEERDRWEEEFIDASKENYDPSKLEELQNQLLNEASNLEDLEKEFEETKKAYDPNN